MLQAGDLQFINSGEERGNGGEWISCCSSSILKALIYEYEKRRGVVLALRAFARPSSRFASFTGS